MVSEMVQRRGRKTERFFLLVITVVLALLFVDLFKVVQRDFEEVPQRLREGTIVNLNDVNADKRIRALLEKGFYFEDKRDVAVATAAIGRGLSQDNEFIDNIGELNKIQYNVAAEEAYLFGGVSYKKRVALSRNLLGFSGRDSIRYLQEKKAPPLLPATNNLQQGKHTIKGIIYKNDVPAAGVLVRLEMLIPQDSIYSATVSEVENTRIEEGPALRRIYAVDTAGNKQVQSLSAYARTGAGGDYAFTGLPEKSAFEVLPLQLGFQFGPSKGVQGLDEDLSFPFYGVPHTVRLLSGKDFNNLKREGSLIVRTPQEVTRWYWIIAGAFFLAFIALHIFLSFRFPQADQLVVPVVMLLTGLSLLTLLSLQDPLRDRFLAESTLWYFVMGFAGLCLLLFFNLRRFTPDAGLYRMFLFANLRSAAKGWPWAGLAVFLLVLTILVGTGPEGSGVKVNLFGFQPSEVVKFFIVVFLAGFFAANEKFISEYASARKRWSFFYIALIAIITTIFLFLMLGDLGPAIVVCFTFIILFSFSRGDFEYMVGAVLVYVLAIWISKNIWLATAITAALVILTTLFIRKRLSESAIMALVVVAGFMLLDQIPFLSNLFPGPVQRLIDRKAIWQNAWDNEVFGGDQVANGIWAMSGGGITGQGAGEGFAKTIPEAHTDMILPSIGEEFGWAGIVCLFILYLLYLHRSIIIGRQTGTPFLFYVCAGIGICTFVQFLLIGGGSTGALPLSGVSLPFVSYGGSSLVCNLLAAGFLLSASSVQGTAVQMAYVTRQQDKNLIPALIAACIGVVLLTVNVSRYLFNNKKWVVQPALVAERSGARKFSYNPRIAILMNRLQAGSLFDRKGKLLATSNPQTILKQQDSLLAAGLAIENLEALSRRRLHRYYPFGEHLFFWTGDANTGVFTGSANGYFAEYELGAELRGFKTPTVNYNVTANRFREERFLPQAAKAMTVSKRDYTALAPLLLAGINSREVEAFKQRNRDVQLTIDAALQTNLQKGLQGDDSLQNNRVSIVIMEDSTGDVLASAAWPLPPVNDWEKLTLSVREQNKLPYWSTLSDLGFTYATQPGSTAKIATALAAFNKLGEAAAKRTLFIRPEDLIRVRSAEPDEPGNIGLERALVRSNNSYFIKLANEEQLQEEMATLYLQTGMFLRGVGGYYFENAPNEVQQEEWRAFWRNTEFRSLVSYNKNDIRRTRGRGISGMAWGQGELIATPAAVARLAAGIANKGIMMPNRFVLKISDSVLAIQEGIRIAKEPTYAGMLTDFMKKQSAGKINRLKIAVAGKTGTPERIFHGQRINDGWYVFFVPKDNGAGHIVTCIRIENTKGSSDAVKLAGSLVIPELLERGYIKGFASGKVTDTAGAVLE